MRANYEIYSERTNVDKLAEIAVHDLEQMQINVDLYWFNLVLAETLANAFLYGSLGLSYEQRQRVGEDAFWQEVKKREQQAENQIKTIRLEMNILPDSLICSISDQGSGFDWHYYLELAESHLNPRPDDKIIPLDHGRGIFLIRSHVDRLKWNEKGNRIEFSIAILPEDSGEGEVKMEIELEKRSGVNIISVDGRLTVGSSQTFFTQMVSLLEKGENDLVLDMSQLEFIDSTGLGTVIRILKRVEEAAGRIRLSSPQPKVHEMLKLTRMDNVFKIYQSLDQAFEDK